MGIIAAPIDQGDLADSAVRQSDVCQHCSYKKVIYYRGVDVDDRI